MEINKSEGEKRIIINKLKTCVELINLKQLHSFVMAYN